MSVPQTVYPCFAQLKAPLWQIAGKRACLRALQSFILGRALSATESGFTQCCPSKFLTLLHNSEDVFEPTGEDFVWAQVHPSAPAPDAAPALKTVPMPKCRPVLSDTTNEGLRPSGASSKDS